MAVENPCVILQASGLDQDQINMAQALTYLIAFQAGYDIIPEVAFDPKDKTIKVCYPGIPVDPKEFLDTDIYIQTYTTYKADQDQKIVDAQAEKQVVEDEKTNNILYGISFEESDILVDGQDDIKSLLKLLARCINATAYKGGFK